MNVTKVVATAALVAGVAVAAAPNALACDACHSTVITQPAVIDTTMALPTTVITQPAVIERRVVDPVVLTRPMVVEPRRNLLNLDTPFFGIHLF